MLLRQEFDRIHTGTLGIGVASGKPEDYANPIEPSVRGGAKIAGAIARLITEHDFSRHRSEVFPQPAHT